MTIVAWGLLGPEKLGGERRTRTLGLGVTVRAFNDLAVPGLGGDGLGSNSSSPLWASRSLSVRTAPVIGSATSKPPTRLKHCLLASTQPEWLAS